MSVRKFVTRPVEVEAIQLTRANWPAIREWAFSLRAEIREATPPPGESIAAWVPTGIGAVAARHGWWIVRKGTDLDVMDHAEFIATYQAADHA